MHTGMRERLNGWGARLSFAAVLLVVSEWGVWQTPIRFGVLDWLGVGVVYVALAAMMLDLIARLRLRDLPGLMLIAGVYGLLNATLISHITARDLPASLLVRPLGAQPLAFLAALAVFQILASGRATGPLEFVAAAGAGLVWGIWVRWFPVVSTAPIPAVAAGEAVAALGIGLLACAALRALLPPSTMRRPDDWQLTLPEWGLTGAILVAALAVGLSRDVIGRIDVAIVVALGSFLLAVLVASQSVRRGPSVLHAVTPPRRPNPAAWFIVLLPLLGAGWIGYHLPGSGDSSTQSDILFGALTLFGVLWPPVVSALVGMQAFVQLTREGW